MNEALPTLHREHNLDVDLCVGIRHFQSLHAISLLTEFDGRCYGLATNISLLLEFGHEGSETDSIDSPHQLTGRTGLSLNWHSVLFESGVLEVNL